MRSINIEGEEITVCPYCDTVPLLYYTSVSEQWNLLCECRGNPNSTNHLSDNYKGRLVTKWNNLKLREGVRKIVGYTRNETRII